MKTCTVTEAIGCRAVILACNGYGGNPALVAESKNPLQLDSKAATIGFDEYTNSENRYRMLKKANPKQADELMKKAAAWTKAHFAYYQKLAALNYDDVKK